MAKKEKLVDLKPEKITDEQLKKLQEKVGPPISREEPGIEKVEYDLKNI